MSWEKRNGNGRYLTRSRRVDGRIIREYIGTGPMADIVALEIEFERAERESQKLEFQEVKRRGDNVDAQLDEFLRLSLAIADGTLIAHGWRKHNQSEWRKRK